MVDYASMYDGYWNRPDRIGESSFSDPGKIANQILSTCGLGRILDVGCGMGTLVRELLKRGADAYGVDVSKTAVEYCNKYAPGRFLEGSVLSLSFKDGEFDTVVSTDCMEHLAPEDVPLALAQIHRVADRYVFLQIATTQDRDNHWHLTVEGRAWWEQRCFEAGFRKHPAYYEVNEYESLNNDGWQIFSLLEKIPTQTLADFPLSKLAVERDLHMDMMRETGERSDAHIIRYKLAADYVRQGDQVLDAACGLGYGSYFIRQNTKVRSVTGVDGSEYAIAYAKACFASVDNKLVFKQGYLPGCLKDYPDGCFDVILTFETLEHVENPTEILDEFYRLLSPGGRIVASVPNDWSDESGNDPNPYHLHVYTYEKLKEQIEQRFLLESVFQQIASGCKIRQANNQWQRRTRKLQRVNPAKDDMPDAEWWVMVGMKDPVPAGLKYRESVYGYTCPPENLLAFERDYANPWLLRSMVEFPFRAKSDPLLSEIAKRVIEKYGHQSGADSAAALAVIGYRLMEEEADAERIVVFIERLEPYLNAEPANPHLLRWQVSLMFLSAQLKKQIGDLNGAFEQLYRVSCISIAGFSPTVGTKIVDAAYEAGLIAAARKDTALARECWMRGVERAYAFMMAPPEEFLGDMQWPHEFPTIVAVEFMDSSVRCLKALRSSVPCHELAPGLLYSEARRNWKSLLVVRMEAIHSMEVMIRERDATIAAFNANLLRPKFLVRQLLHVVRLVIRRRLFQQ